MAVCACLLYVVPKCLRACVHISMFVAHNIKRCVTHRVAVCSGRVSETSKGEPRMNKDAQHYLQQKDKKRKHKNHII